MAQYEYRVGDRQHGFVVTSVSPLPELHATLVQLHHERTGARLVHLDRDDDNNLFGVGFRTTPQDSTGVAHILEHTVLCGSKRYPVRDPFFTMLKRSLSSFMNALTASDWTCYPFSSQNQADFYNLMGIYLDAAFFPLLRERDFRQEGHRLEFTDPADGDSPLQFKGVVYNEMKGAMADPSSLLHRRLTRALYPTVTYGFNSGGEPADILDLTYEQLKEFHSTYYHPANAWFFTYGNLPLEGHLKVIEEQALSQFGPLQVNSAVPDEVRFPEPRKVVETFPVDAGESLARRSMVQLAWLTCPVSDQFERLGMMLLSELLLGNPAAPLYKALLDSGLGQNLAPGTGYHDDYRETYFAVGLQGADPEAVDGIEALVLNTLQETVRNGFSSQQIEAAIHQLEFSYREVNGDQYPYGLLLLMRMFGSWLHADDPVSPLCLEKDLVRLRQELANGPFFEDLIRRQLLDNAHRVTLLLKPDAQQKEREEQLQRSRLDTIEKNLTARDREELVKLGVALQHAQEAPEDLSCLPTLELEDIPSSQPLVSCETYERQGVQVRWFEQPTNGIGYFAANLDIGDLPSERLKDLPLFCSLLTKIGAAGHNYLEMAERVTGATGGVQASAAIFDSPKSLDEFQLAVELRGKALQRNQQKMFEILRDFCTAPDFSDLKRLHTVLQQMKTSLENSVPGSGHSYASRVAGGSLTSAGRLREEWSGLHLIRIVKELAARQPEQLAEFAQSLQHLASLVFRRDRLRCAITAEEAVFKEMGPALDAFLADLSAGDGIAAAAARPTPFEVKASGWYTAVPVSYVARVFRAVPLEHPDGAALMVLAKLLRGGYLHREIREKGGAYGGMANYDAQGGLFAMLSYRDPHLLRTLDVYKDAVQWAAEGQFAAVDIKEAILGVFSQLDRPLSPGGKGIREFHYLLQGLTPEARQAFRQRILAVDAATISRVARCYLVDGWDASAVSVVAGEDMLQDANRKLGDASLVLERI
jgi:hypothetical protein